jgi:hypothetical protein
LFFVDELETPAVPSFSERFVSQNPVGFLNSQSCVKDVFVGLYPPPKSENPGMLSESSSLAEEEFQFAVVDGCG